MNVLDIFSSADGGVLTARLLGFRTVCSIEHRRYHRDVIVSRQNDGCIQPFPIWTELRTFDTKPWNQIVDGVFLALPKEIQASRCITTESDTWKQIERTIVGLEPKFVFMEASEYFVNRGAKGVFGKFSEMGYGVKWCIMGAYWMCAPHERKRLWVVADSDDERFKKQNFAAITEDQRLYNWRVDKARREWWSRESELDRVVDEATFGVDRLHTIGSGWVPEVAQLAFNTLTQGKYTNAKLAN